MKSLVRSWIALALVTGLLAYCVAAFGVNDARTRSTLIGALASAVGSAVAFYFSTKSADQARQDVITALAGGTEVVPDVTGKTEDEAVRILGRTSLKMEIAPESRPADPSASITTQDPAAGAYVQKGSSVRVAFQTENSQSPASQ
ncbi:PASTA domain-containing protein [Streptomyces sp. CA-249302]|uniref:PASTA domain-containing protein n=1 Tax=Streptomyces sp. CA-249302 TaxID=3240058 RepID=UPI003D8DEC17